MSTRLPCYNVAMIGRLISARLTPLLFAPIFLLLLAGCAGVIAGASEPIPPSGEVPRDLRKVGEVQGILLREHIDHDAIGENQLIDGAIRGMLDSLDDPYASYLSAEQLAREREGHRGYFEGIGAHVEMTDAGVTVRAPIPGGPAEKAGIRPGDIVLAVDGMSIAGLTLTEAVNLIRGPDGSEVALLLRRSNPAEELTIVVKRGRIQIDSVNFQMLDDDIGHLWIRNFSNNTEEEVRSALDQFQDAGGRQLVLDLRNNPGGLLNSVIDVADLFLDGGLILYEVDAQGKRTDHPAENGGPALSIPMLVLINEHSASASEILAGAIKSAGRAPVVGQTTFGKGSVNITRELSDGSAIYFSIRRWHLPDGTQIEGQGVTPDIEIKAEVRTLPIPLQDDIALRRAVEILQR